MVEGQTTLSCTQVRRDPIHFVQGGIYEASFVVERGRCVLSLKINNLTQSFTAARSVTQVEASSITLVVLQASPLRFTAPRFDRFNTFHRTLSIPGRTDTFPRTIDHRNTLGTDSRTPGTRGRCRPRPPAGDSRCLRHSGRCHRTLSLSCRGPHAVLHHRRPWHAPLFVPFERD